MYKLPATLDKIYRTANAKWFVVACTEVHLRTTSQEWEIIDTLIALQPEIDLDHETEKPSTPGRVEKDDAHELNKMLASYLRVPYILDDTTDQKDLDSLPAEFRDDEVREQLREVGIKYVLFFLTAIACNIADIWIEYKEPALRHYRVENRAT